MGEEQQLWEPGQSMCSGVETEEDCFTSGEVFHVASRHDAKCALPLRHLFILLVDKANRFLAGGK